MPNRLSKVQQRLAKWRRAFFNGLQRWQNLTSAMIALAAAAWAWQYAQRQIDIGLDQLAVVRRQADNAQQQLVIAAKQAEAVQRQLALFERDQRPLLYLTPKDPPGYNSEERYIYWNFQFENVGKSAALSVSWEAFLKIAEPRFRNTGRSATDAGRILPAGVKEWATAFSDQTHSASEFARLIKTDGAIELYVKIQYADAGGVPYEVAECFTYFSNGSMPRNPATRCEAELVK